MSSLFSKDPEVPPPLSNLEKIESEISHLKKKSSVRDAPGSRKAAPWFFSLVLLLCLWIYIMDPCLHAWHKYQAIHAYLYLHNNGSDKLAQQMVATGILNELEANVLNQRQGSFQDYFSTPDGAIHTAQSVIDYMNDVRALHHGDYDKLGLVGKLRYNLFIKSNIPLPTEWDSLDPSVRPD